MAHELYLINGESSMAYTNETPWHGLGQQIEDGEPIEVWAKKAHLDWNIIETPVYFYGENPRTTQRTLFPTNHFRKPVPRKKALIRSDNSDFLSIVGEGYQTVQPMEILEFFRDLVATGGFKLSTAGSIFNGLKMWALAETGDPMNIAGDKVRQFLLLATSCDGTMANTGMFTTTRVVCNNTLSVSLREGESGRASKYVTMPHSTKFDAAQMKQELGLGQQAFARFAESANEMTKYRLEDEVVAKLFAHLFAKKDESGLYIDAAPVKVVSNIINFYKNGVGQDLPSTNGTLWGAVNAVTGYVDHIRRARSSDSKMNNALFGEGAALKDKMWAMADDMIRKAA